VARLCIFCGAKANSREHAIPKWIAKRFGMRGVMMHPVVMLNITPRKQPVSFGSHRERIFCSDCNTHFKSLEDEVIPILEAMGRGKPILLGETEQDVLGRWGAKTGYALVAAEKDLRELIPVEHRRMLREQNTVHPLTWIGYASWLGSAQKFGGDHSIQTPQERTIRAYGAILTFQKVALKMFGFYEPVPEHVIAFDTDSLKQIVPRLDREVAWPLFPAAGNRNTQSLAELVPLTPTN
jgi:hypothetical protein